MSGKYLTPLQIAERMNVQVVKVRGWIKSGRLPAVNVSAGKRAEYRILESALIDFEKSLLVVKSPAATAKKRKKCAGGIPHYFR